MLVTCTNPTGIASEMSTRSLYKRGLPTAGDANLRLISLTLRRRALLPLLCG